MKILFGVLIIFFTIQILRCKGFDRLFFYFSAILLIPMHYSIFPYISFLRGHLIFVTAFFVSMLINEKYAFKSLLKCPLWWPLLAILISFLLIGFFDPRFSFFQGVYKAFLAFVSSYLAFLIGWFGVRRLSYAKLRQLLRRLLRLSLLFTFFGVITFIFRYNPLMEDLDIGNFSREAELSLRGFRVVSTFVSSSVFGFVTGFFALTATLFLPNKKRIDILATALLFINSLLSSTRAGIIPILIVVCIYLIRNFFVPSKKYIRYLSAVLCLFILLFILLPENTFNVVSQYSTIISSTFDDSAQEMVGGSSYDARLIQISTAFKYLAEKPWFGHGLGYAGENTLDPGLLGMESYLCFLGVEYGIVHICCVLAFFICLLVFWVKKRTVDRKLATFSFLITLSFILFLSFAWVGDIWLYVLPFLGISSRILYLKGQNQRILWHLYYGTEKNNICNR